MNQLHAHARIADPQPPRNQNPERDSSNALKRHFSDDPIGGTTADEATAGEGSSLGSLASACAVSQHPAVKGTQGEPVPPGAVPEARLGMPSALLGRLVISWESPGLPRPTPSPGGSSVGTAEVPPSPGSSSPEHTGARPSPVLLVCSSRSQSPSPALDAMAPCSGRAGLPICICGQVALQGEREPPTECERAGTPARPAKEGGSRCHRSGRRRMRRQARRARRGSRSRRRRPRAGSSRGWFRPSAESGVGCTEAIPAASRPLDPEPAGLWRAQKRPGGRSGGGRTIGSGPRAWPGPPTLRR